VYGQTDNVCNVGDAGGHGGDEDHQPQDALVFDRDEITTEEDLTDAARSSCPLLARRTTASCAKPEGRKLSLVVRNGRSLASVGPNRG
jgi:hypothetical protein